VRLFKLKKSEFHVFAFVEARPKMIMMLMKMMMMMEYGCERRIV
jgi:hypothetical protein